MPASDQGFSIDRYMLIPRVLIFVVRGTSVLLLKGASSKRLWPGKYNGVGGHLEPGEDVLSAARRELLEETGLTADLRLCGTIIMEAGENPGIGIYVFFGEHPQGQPGPSTEGRPEWIHFSEVPHLDAVEDLPVILERIQKMKPDDPPFSARSFYDEKGKITVRFVL
jgi:8-oxo-dGTP diphosphatase